MSEFNPSFLNQLIFMDAQINVDGKIVDGTVIINKLHLNSALLLSNVFGYGMCPAVFHYCNEDIHGYIIIRPDLVKEREIKTKFFPANLEEKKRFEDLIKSCGVR